MLSAVIVLLQAEVGARLQQSTDEFSADFAKLFRFQQAVILSRNNEGLQREYRYYPCSPDTG